MLCKAVVVVSAVCCSFCSSSSHFYASWWFGMASVPPLKNPEAQTLHMSRSRRLRLNEKYHLVPKEQWKAAAEFISILDAPVDVMRLLMCEDVQGLQWSDIPFATSPC